MDRACAHMQTHTRIHLHTEYILYGYSNIISDRDKGATGEIHCGNTQTVTLNQSVKYRVKYI